MTVEGRRFHHQPWGKVDIGFTISRRGEIDIEWAFF
jgi:hypothetical protein